MLRKRTSQGKGRCEYRIEVMGNGMKRYISEEGCEKGILKGSIVD